MSRVEPRMRFGDYEAVQFIAAGGMGETWGGVKLSLTRSVAIKVLHPDAAQDADAQSLFFREARISAALEHGRIVSVLDYGIEHDLLYLVMARVDGVDLRTFLNAYCKKGKLESLPALLVAHFAGEILEALRYAHSRPVGGRTYGVIHRDIKPANVLLSSNGEIFVTDFGIARYTEDATWRGHVMGTPCYMAPEQADGRACPQSDIFGVGCVVYYLLTGRAPLRTDGSRLDTSLVYREPIPEVERDDLPPPLREFLRRSLAFDLAERYQTADEALADLDKLKVYDTGERHSTVARRLYRSCVAPPKSHVTGYLQREDAGASFLLSYYQERAKARAEGRDPVSIVSAYVRPEALIIGSRDYRGKGEDGKDNDSKGGSRGDGDPKGESAEDPDPDDSGEEVSGDDFMPWLSRSQREGEGEGGGEGEDGSEDEAVPWYWSQEPGIGGVADAPDEDDGANGEASQDGPNDGAAEDGDHPDEGEGRGSTLVMPPHGDEGVPEGRRPRTGTVPMPSTIAPPGAVDPKPDATERHPPPPSSSPDHVSPFRSDRHPSELPGGTLRVSGPALAPAPPLVSWPVEVAAAPAPVASPHVVVQGAGRLTEAGPSTPRRSPWLVAGAVILLTTALNLGWLALGDRGRSMVSPGASSSDEPIAVMAAGSPTAPAEGRLVHAAMEPADEPTVMAAGAPVAAAGADTPEPERQPQPEPEPEGGMTGTGSPGPEGVESVDRTEAPTSEGAENAPAGTEPSDDAVPFPGPAATPSSPAPTPPATTASPSAPESPPKPEPKPRVMALFFLKGATHGEIRIAGRTVAVESVATLHLRPGHYAVNWRRRGETEWHGAGKVKIPALDPKAEYSEIRLDDGSYKGFTRPIPGKRGAR